MLYCTDFKAWNVAACYRYEVWLALVLSVPLGGLFFTLTLKMDSHLAGTKQIKKFYLKWYRSTWSAFAAMVLQGTCDRRQTAHQYTH